MVGLQQWHRSLSNDLCLRLLRYCIASLGSRCWPSPIPLSLCRGDRFILLATDFEGKTVVLLNFHFHFLAKSFWGGEFGICSLVTRPAFLQGCSTSTTLWFVLDLRHWQLGQTLLRRCWTSPTSLLSFSGHFGHG